MYLCVNDRYTRDTEVYGSVEDFQAMCEACFGERAELYRDGENYHDDTGEIVLQKRDEC
jgi:hypothetical protein